MGCKDQNEEYPTLGWAQLTCSLWLLEAADPPAQLWGRHEKLPRKSSEEENREVRGVRQDGDRGRVGRSQADLCASAENDMAAAATGVPEALTPA